MAGQVQLYTKTAAELRAWRRPVLLTKRTPRHSTIYAPTWATKSALVEFHQGTRGRRRSRSPRLERPRHQRHDGHGRHDDQQKRDHAHRNAENQERECCKHGCRHYDRYRREQPRTPSGDDNGLSIALNHDHGVISLRGPRIERKHERLQRLRNAAFLDRLKRLRRRLDLSGLRKYTVVALSHPRPASRSPLPGRLRGLAGRTWCRAGCFP
jgi:hypothetical protein